MELFLIFFIIFEVKIEISMCALLTNLYNTVIMSRHLQSCLDFILTYQYNF